MYFKFDKVSNKKKDFTTDLYLIRNYENYIKAKTPNKIINLLNKFIFSINKFLLNLILDKYSRIMIANILTERLQSLYEKEKELKYKTPTMQFTEEEINDAIHYNIKDIIYSRALIELYLL